MSEPIRYTGKTEGSLLGSPHWEHPEGEWVKWQDYANLKAENERLRKELADAQENYHLVNETVAKLIKEGKQS